MRNRSIVPAALTLLFLDLPGNAMKNEGAVIEEGVYQLKNKALSTILGLIVGENEALEVWTSEENAVTPLIPGTEYWLIKNTEEPALFYIQNRKTKEFLSVSKGDPSFPTLTFFLTQNPESWIISKVGDGAYRIQYPKDEKFLSVERCPCLNGSAYLTLRLGLTALSHWIINPE